MKTLILIGWILIILLLVLITWIGIIVLLLWKSRLHDEFDDIEINYKPTKTNKNG